MEPLNVIEKSTQPLVTDSQIECLAAKHSELCNGVYASFNGGAGFEHLEPLLAMMIDQASEIEFLFKLKEHI